MRLEEEDSGENGGLRVVQPYRIRAVSLCLVSLLWERAIRASPEFWPPLAMEIWESSHYPEHLVPGRLVPTYQSALALMRGQPRVLLLNIRGQSVSLADESLPELPLEPEDLGLRPYRQPLSTILNDSSTSSLTKLNVYIAHVLDDILLRHPSMMGNLESLVLQHPEQDDLGGFSTSQRLPPLPKLRKAVFITPTDLFFDQLDVPFYRQLTHLFVQGISPWAWDALMESCCSLRKGTFVLPQNLDGPQPLLALPISPFDTDEKIVQNELSELVLIVTQRHAIRPSRFHHFHWPNLTTLKLFCYPREGFSDTIQTEERDLIFPSLTHLTLMGLSLTYLQRDLTPFLKASSSLEELILGPSCGNDLANLFRHLSSSVTPPLPSLRRLRINCAVPFRLPFIDEPVHPEVEAQALMHMVCGLLVDLVVSLKFVGQGTGKAAPLESLILQMLPCEKLERLGALFEERIKPWISASGARRAPHMVEVSIFDAPSLSISEYVPLPKNIVHWDEGMMDFIEKDPQYGFTVPSDAMTIVL
ncbi:hypothetical protein CC1G_11105 [Coprinopsis cinerea okayama7|uniref:Uncharacterized protein n=1 Tax=Coprinopsis cinerea (strain Okayama-7 / 130 / ATCC MYA-4618 / FGSC 9003) TaxID=240176 RepID=A8P7P6_COPC7|nr:hypothetical protein CC1G_11105 [Coprinopsis cinerea okayama7\|eukprot:XP_001839405.1 hypothetical protein CC1G_11105 [Coprinopsis cinerea okayama7\